MKKNLKFLIPTLMLILALTLNFAFSFAASPNLDATLVRIEPFPLKPGSVAEVWIQVTNAGTEKANLKTMIEGSYFYDVLEPGNKSLVLFGGETILVRGKIIVKADAKEGTHKLKFSMLVDNVKITKDFPVKVVSEPEIVIQNVTKEVIYKEANEVEVELVNIKDTDVRDLVVNIASNDFKIVGANKLYLDYLRSRESKTIAFEVYPISQEDVGTIKLTLTYSYGDQESKTEEHDIGVKIVKEPIIDINFMRFENNEVVLQVVNRGEGEARFLTISCDNVSPENTYIGNLASDDFESFKVKSQSNEILCHATYKTNKYVEKTIKVSIEEIKDNNKSFNWLYLAIIILVALIILFVVRKKRE